MYRIKTSLKPPINLPVHTIDVSSDGRWLAAGQTVDQGRSILSVWDLQTLSMAHRIDLEHALLRVRFSPESEIALTTAGVDAAVMFYNIEGKKQLEFPTNGKSFPWLHYAHQANRFVIGGARLLVLERNRAVLQELWSDDASDNDLHPSGVLTADGQHVLTAGTAPHKIQVFEPESKNLVTELAGAPDEVHWLELDPQERYLVALERYAKGVFVWDLTQKQRHLPNVFSETMRSFWCCHFHPTGDYCVLGNLIGYVCVIRMNDGAFVVDDHAHQARVWDTKFSPNGEQLFTAGEDAVVHVWQQTR